MQYILTENFLHFFSHFWRRNWRLSGRHLGRHLERHLWHHYRCHLGLHLTKYLVVATLANWEAPLLHINQLVFGQIQPILDKKKRENFWKKEMNFIKNWTLSSWVTDHYPYLRATEDLLLEEVEVKYFNHTFIF